jgi:hypothetical protein
MALRFLGFLHFCEVDFHVFGARQYLKVLRAVIAFVTVDVVDDFVWKQRPPKHPLRNNPVFVTPPALTIRFALAAVALLAAVVHSSAARLLLGREELCVVAVLIGVSSQFAASAGARLLAAFGVHPLAVLVTKTTATNRSATVFD